MPPSARPLMSLLILLACAGCSRTETPSAAAGHADAEPDAMLPAKPAAATPIAAATHAAPVRSQSATSYTCDGGQHVDVAREVAVVHLADGRAIEIRRDPADPSRFVNEAVEFAIAGDRAELAQDERGTARCKAG